MQQDQPQAPEQQTNDNSKPEEISNPQDLPILSDLDKQTLSLIALFQSVLLVQELAQKGTIEDRDLVPIISSIIALEPDRFEDIYKPLSSLHLGAAELLDVLKLRAPKHRSDAIHYAIRIMHLEKLFQKNPSLQEKLRNQLSVIEHQSKFFDGLLDDNLFDKFNQTYIETLGMLSYRIQINGSKSHLENPQNAAKIRTLLLGAIRACHLWRHYGGSKLNILFKNKPYIQSIESFLEYIK